jgi:uncharacterized C2H2 Zn-finger protein
VGEEKLRLEGVFAMSDVILRFSIPPDDDGFITFQCKYCGQAFKLTAQDFDEDDVVELYCPCCGLTNAKNKFYPKCVEEAAVRLVENHIADLINGSFKKMERDFRGNKFVSFTVNKEVGKQADKELFEAENELESVSIQCCKKLVKVRSLDKEIGIYCPYCGVK